MDDLIGIGIAGYGNLGRGVECAMGDNPDMELRAVFTRRDTGAVALCAPQIPVVPFDRIAAWEGRLDVMILCGGSATDLPWMTPAAAKYFHVVDSFDTHGEVAAHAAAVDAAAAGSGHIAIVSAGWDPGLFSLARTFAAAVLPRGKSYTFWGEGVSQGHSDAIRRIPGVVDARQYTIPQPQAMDAVRSGENPPLTAREMHRRHCFVAAQPGADRGRIEQSIRTMPHYFRGYDTTVEFISVEEMRANHSALPHGGTVIRSGTTGYGGEHLQRMECRLTLGSNAQFTAGVLLSCARAAFRMGERGVTGCRTMLDIAPADLFPGDRGELLARLM